MDCNDVIRRLSQFRTYFHFWYWFQKLMSNSDVGYDRFSPSLCNKN